MSAAQSPYYVWAAIGLMILATQMTRMLPFILFGRGKRPSQALLYLGRALPPAMMALLVAYCFRNVDWFGATHGLPELAAAALVVVLHRWKKNALFSIFGGTAFYMLLVQVVLV